MRGTSLEDSLALATSLNGCEGGKAMTLERRVAENARIHGRYMVAFDIERKAFKRREHSYSIYMIFTNAMLLSPKYLNLICNVYLLIFRVELVI